MKNTELLHWMLDDVRKETLKGVSHLSAEQLFQSPVEGEAPIGSFLMHLGEVDAWWYSVISGKEMSDEIKKAVYFDCWYDSKEAKPPTTPLEPEIYADAITKTRNIVLDYINTLKDEQLEEKVVMKWSGGEKELTRKWIIYHLIEHEAHHRGQMFMLIRKAGWKKKNKNK